MAPKYPSVPLSHIHNAITNYTNAAEKLHVHLEKDISLSVVLNSHKVVSIRLFFELRIKSTMINAQMKKWTLCWLMRQLEIVAVIKKNERYFFNPEWHKITLARRIQNLASPLLQNNLTPWARKVVLCDPSCFIDGKNFRVLAKKKNGEEINQEKVIFAHLQLEKFGNVRFKIWEINLAHGVDVLVLYFPRNLTMMRHKKFIKIPGNDKKMNKLQSASVTQALFRGNGVTF